MTKATNNCVQTLDTIKARITIHRGLGLSWRQIAALAEFGGSSAGMLSNVHNGYVPKTAETRKRLGLPPLAVPAVPCPECNEVHLVGWCVKVDGPPVKPKPTYNRKRQPRPRLSIHSEYPENAALTITNKKGSDRLYIERLVDYLNEYLEGEK